MQQNKTLDGLDALGFYICVTIQQHVSTLKPQ